MNCKRIKELLMTDYIDGEMSAELQKQLKQHLNSCDKCRQFEETLQKTVVEPFKKAQEFKPPEAVWDRIRTAITAQETQTEPFLERLRNRLFDVFYVPKPVFAAVAVMTVILITAAVIFIKLPFDNQKMASAYLHEQIQFLSYLDLDYANTDDIDLGTSIEEYFL